MRQNAYNCAKLQASELLTVNPSKLYIDCILYPSSFNPSLIISWGLGKWITIIYPLLGSCTNGKGNFHGELRFEPYFDPVSREDKITELSRKQNEQLFYPPEYDQSWWRSEGEGLIRSTESPGELSSSMIQGLTSVDPAVCIQ